MSYLQIIRNLIFSITIKYLGIFLLIGFIYTISPPNPFWWGMLGYPISFLLMWFVVFLAIKDVIKKLPPETFSIIEKRIGILSVATAFIVITLWLITSFLSRIILVLTILPGWLSAIDLTGFTFLPPTSIQQIAMRAYIGPKEFLIQFFGAFIFLAALIKLIFNKKIEMKLEPSNYITLLLPLFLGFFAMLIIQGNYLYHYLRIFDGFKVKTDFKGESIQSNESTPSNAYKLYKLIDVKGVESELQAENLIQNGLYYKDRKSGEIYYLAFDNSFDDERPIYKLKSIEGVNNDKFFVYQKDGRYATDLKNVYFVKDEEASVFGGSGNYSLHVLRGADPKTFEPKIVTNFPVSQGNYFQGLYSRDSKTVFYGSTPLPDVDAETFKISDHVSVTSDKNHVYLWNKTIPGADPLTYVVIADYSAEGRGTVYGKDKNGVFVDYCLLRGVDAESFSINWNQNLGKDEFIDRFGIFNIERRENEAGSVELCSVIR